MIILRYWDRNEGQVLASDYPELAEQWNYDRNGAMTPWDVTIGSNRKVWWKCSLGHEWEARIFSRTVKSSGCPYCSGRCAWPGFNDLASKRPDIVADRDYSLNGTNLPVQYTVGSEKKAWWVCRRGHPSYLMAIFNRSNGRGCPKCTTEKIAAICSKKVLCYAPDGRLHGAYPNVQAAAGETGRHRSTVRASAAGEKSSRDGYLYRFADQHPVQDRSSQTVGRFKDCLSQPISVRDPVMFMSASPPGKSR